MKGIFISYRRVYAAGHAGRLFDRLADHFGKDAVFIDVEGIEAGVDFVEVIEQAVGGCTVLLAVIGRSWLTCVDEQGRRRLDDPQDFIRLEIGSALAHGLRTRPSIWPPRHPRRRQGRHPQSPGRRMVRPGRCPGRINRCRPARA